MIYLHWRTWLGLYVQWQFLAALQREMQATVPPVDSVLIRREIRRQLREIYAANVHRIQHPPDRFHLTWVSLLMAAYCVLLPVVEAPQQAMALIGAAIQEPFRRITRVALWVR